MPPVRPSTLYALDLLPTAAILIQCGHVAAGPVTCRLSDTVRSSVRTAPAASRPQHALHAAFPLPLLKKQPAGPILTSPRRPSPMPPIHSLRLPCDVCLSHAAIPYVTHVVLAFPLQCGQSIAVITRQDPSGPLPPTQTSPLLSRTFLPCAAIPPRCLAAVEAAEHEAVGYFVFLVVFAAFFTARSAAVMLGIAALAHWYFPYRALHDSSCANASEITWSARSGVENTKSMLS